MEGEFSLPRVDRARQEPVSERGRCSRLSSPLSCRAMSSLLDDLNAFLQKHRRCGKMDGGVEEGRGWMTCDGCDAMLSSSVLRPDRLPANQAEEAYRWPLCATGVSTAGPCRRGEDRAFALGVCRCRGSLWPSILGHSFFLLHVFFGELTPLALHLLDEAIIAARLDDLVELGPVI